MQFGMRMRCVDFGPGRIGPPGVFSWASVCATMCILVLGIAFGASRAIQMPHSPHTVPPILPSADELYRLMVENVTDYAILMLSPDGRVATWTEGAGRSTGWAEDEVLGRPISVFYPPEDAEGGAAERDL